MTKPEQVDLCTLAIRTDSPRKHRLNKDLDYESTQIQQRPPVRLSKELRSIRISLDSVAIREESACIGTPVKFATHARLGSNMP